MANKKKTLELSDEERERRRQNMIRLKEEGKVGPQFGKLGGRPRKPRASEMLAEEARKEFEQMLTVLQEGIRSDSEKMRLAYLQTWLGMEQEEAKLKLQEEKQEFDIGKASREELITMLAGKLSEGPIADQLGIVDGSAEDITEVSDLGHEQSEGNGSGD